MWRWLFGARRSTSGQDINAADADALYDEFCRTFRDQRGLKFVETWKAEGHHQLLSWLRPATPCAVPRTFVKLIVDATRRGVRLWDQPSIAMMYVGDSDNGGLPPQASLDALAKLTQVLAKPIKLFYRPKPDGEVMVMEWQPLGPAEPGAAPDRGLM